jgi:hypothetical protein
MTENEKTIKAFCDMFSPSLRYVKTDRINNMPYPDAWQTSYWHQDRSVGMTVVAYGGGIHAFIEAAGRGDIAANAGKVFARALDLFKQAEAMGADQLPPEFAKLAFDGFDVMPGDHDSATLVWLYRAACLRIAEMKRDPDTEHCTCGGWDTIEIECDGKDVRVCSYCKKPKADEVKDGTA